MKKVILSGGGTGGHIYPALTIAKELSRLEKTDILFVGTAEGMESRIVQKAGYDFRALPAYGLKRKLSLSNMKTLLKTLGNLFRAQKILRDFQPDIVIGTGGYVCGPIVLTAALNGIPTLVQEQNVIPGITNKILSRFVDAVALGYEEAKNRFPHSGKCIYTGNPVRDDILKAKRTEAREKLRVRPEQFMVVAAGGSRGARTINQAMLGVHRHFKDMDDISLYHIAGSGEYESVTEALSAKDGRYGKGSRIVAYEYDMPSVLAAADLVIYRAGAIGLAELAVRGLPSVLIPYPYAAEDHQTFNARVFVAAGAAKMIVDKYLRDIELIQDIENLKNNPEMLSDMSKAGQKLGNTHAGRDIAKLALRLMK